MRHSIHLLLALTLGCSAEIGDEPTPAIPRLGSAPPSAPAWLAFDTLDRPVRFDPTSGAALAHGPPLPGVERDLAPDPWTGDVAVFASEEGDGGEVHRLSADSLASSGAFPIDGRAELWFGPEGLWLFEESYGVRWRRIRRDGQWEPSWGLPPPSSLWPEDGGGFGALVDDGGYTTWLTVDPTAGTIPASAVSFPGVVPAAGRARAARLPDGLALAWTVSGGIVICTLDDQGAVIHERLVDLPGEVRQAAPLTTPTGTWVALALLPSGGAAARVVALDPLADGITPPYTLGGLLDEDPRVDRRMIADGARLIVATSAGLVALDLVVDPPALTADPAFSGAQLRGPLSRRSPMFLQDGGEPAL